MPNLLHKIKKTLEETTLVKMSANCSDEGVGKSFYSSHNPTRSDNPPMCV